MIMDGANTLWYQKPACCWQEALPLGNGRIGAMLYGDAVNERIDLSECTFVSGEAAEHNCQPNAAEAFRQTRGALLRGDYAAADTFAQGMTGRKLNYGTNLPIGSLFLNFDNNEKIYSYRRSLLLDSAISHLEFSSWDGLHTRDTFISNPDQVLALRIFGERSFSICFDSGGLPSCVTGDENDMVAEVHAVECLHSDGETGVTLHLRLRVLAEGGCVLFHNGSVHVRPVGCALVLLAMNTDFSSDDAFGKNRKQIHEAVAFSYEYLLKRHSDDFGQLFGCCSLNMGQAPGLPTDEWLEAVRIGADNSALAALMFQYGRYLLISSSREDSPLPAHLQGVWNDGVACRIGWTCDMHLDINTQMNYWPAHITGLSECTVPLHRWIQETLMPSGRRTAKDTYGLNGWVAHTVANGWGYSAPGWDTWWGMHVTGGAWIATHLWEAWLQTGDRALLETMAYPVIQEAAEFFIGYLAEDKRTGFMLPVPSDSPENGFVYGGLPYSLSEGAYCDIVLIRELFDIYDKICGELGFQDVQREKAAELLKKLPQFKVGKHGQLQEWLNDFEEAVPNHRHTSHLLSVYPFFQITPESTPDLAEAARVTIQRRVSAGGAWEDTGWARSLLLLYSARLHDGETAGRHLLSMQRTLTNPNLLLIHPPVAGADTNVYELDGNTGFAAGIAEMLLQSHDSVLHLLPALPLEWLDGRVSGLCGRGGFIVDIVWKGGVLVEATIKSRFGLPVTLIYIDRSIALKIHIGQTVRINSDFVSISNCNYW